MQLPVRVSLSLLVQYDKLVSPGGYVILEEKQQMLESSGSESGPGNYILAGCQHPQETHQHQDVLVGRLQGGRGTLENLVLTLLRQEDLMKASVYYCPQVEKGLGRDQVDLVLVDNKFIESQTLDGARAMLLFLCKRLCSHE